MEARDRYDSLFRFYLHAGHPVPWRWAKAQAVAESNMQRQAVSRVGARGLLQFMPATWAEIMGDKEPFDPEHQIQAYSIYTARIMDYLKSTDLEKMAAAYNWGMGKVKRADEAWRDLLPEETNAYVRRVRNLYRELQPLP